MVKNVPNLLSFTRIVLSIILIFTEPFSFLFFLLYVSGGLSDILDGFLARKFKITSELGAALDSIGDFVFILVLMYLIYPYVKISEYLTIWIGVIVIFRFGSLFVAFIKFHELAFLHTYLNKATGFLLFCFPLFYVCFGIDLTGKILCVMATISAIEEFLIQIRAKDLNRNIISIFHLKNHIKNSI